MQQSKTKTFVCRIENKLIYTLHPHRNNNQNSFIKNEAGTNTLPFTHFSLSDLTAPSEFQCFYTSASHFISSLVDNNIGQISELYAYFVFIVFFVADKGLLVETSFLFTWSWFIVSILSRFMFGNMVSYCKNIMSGGKATSQGQIKNKRESNTKIWTRFTQ